MTRFVSSVMLLWFSILAPASFGACDFDVLLADPVFSKKLEKMPEPWRNAILSRKLTGKQIELLTKTWDYLNDDRLFTGEALERLLKSGALGVIEQRVRTENRAAGSIDEFYEIKKLILTQAAKDYLASPRTQQDREEVFNSLSRQLFWNRTAELGPLYVESARGFLEQSDQAAASDAFMAYISYGMEKKLLRYSDVAKLMQKHQKLVKQRYRGKSMFDYDGIPASILHKWYSDSDLWNS